MSVWRCQITFAGAPDLNSGDPGEKGDPLVEAIVSAYCFFPVGISWLLSTGQETKNVQGGHQEEEKAEEL